MRGHAAEGVAGATPRDGAFVAILAAIVPDLQVKRGIAEAFATLHTLGTADAKIFVNYILVIRVLNERAFDGRGGTKLVLSSRVEFVWLGREKSRAKLAIAADGITLDAFDRRLFEHTMRGAVAAMQAFGGVNLPDGGFSAGAVYQRSAQRRQAAQRRDARAVPEELTAAERRFGLGFWCHWVIQAG